MARIRDKMQQLKRAEAESSKAERRSKQEEAARTEAEIRAGMGESCVSAERRCTVNEACIDLDTAQLKLRVKPLRRRRHGSKMISSRP